MNDQFADSNGIECHMPFCQCVGQAGNSCKPLCHMFHATNDKAERWTKLILDALPVHLHSYSHLLKDSVANIHLCKCHFNTLNLKEVDNQLCMEDNADPICETSVFVAKHHELTRTMIISSDAVPIAVPTDAQSCDDHQAPQQLESEWACGITFAFA